MRRALALVIAALALLGAGAALAQPALCSYNGGPCADVASDGTLAISAAQAQALIVPTVEAAPVLVLSAPNVTTPNGANIAHTLYNAAATTVISSSSDTSIFSTTGVGSQTSPIAEFFPGAQYEFKDAGIVSTGALNTASATIKVKFGATVVASVTTQTLPVAVSQIAYVSDVLCTIMTGGASGSVLCFGSVTVSNGLIGVAPVISYLSNTTPVSVNLSAPLKLDATASFTSLTGNPTLTVAQATIVQNN